MAAVAWLRARPLSVFTVGCAVSLGGLGAMHFLDTREQYIGVPAALVSMLVVGAALVGGARVGVGLALVSGVAYDALIITDRWLVSGLTSGGVLVVWTLAGLLSGMLGDRYRMQVSRALREAHDARDAVEQVLDATPGVHAGGTVDGVARAVCEGARQSFTADWVALVGVEDDRLHLLAQDPPGEGDDAALTAFPDLRDELLRERHASFIGRLDEHDGPTITRGMAHRWDIQSALRVPVVLDERPVAILNLGWRVRRDEPEPGTLGAIQRFADHAAVALEQARRVAAQREATRLYRRFEASLVPALQLRRAGVNAVVLSRSGERRMRLGGDFVDVLAPEDGSLQAVIGDVMGHGPDAAALGSSLRAAWRAMALDGRPLEKIVRALDRLIAQEAARGGVPGLDTVLATACLVRVARDGDTLTYLVAGHPPPLLLGGDAVTTCEATGMALGVDVGATWTIGTAALPRPWALLLYTDGVIEARQTPAAAERLGIEGLVRELEPWRRRPALERADLVRLFDALERRNGGPLPDDATPPASAPPLATRPAGGRGRSSVIRRRAAHWQRFPYGIGPFFTRPLLPPRLYGRCPALGRRASGASTGARRPGSRDSMRVGGGSTVRREAAAQRPDR